jgi:hypothetical protein
MPEHLLVQSLVPKNAVSQFFQKGKYNDENLSLVSR